MRFWHAIGFSLTLVFLLSCLPGNVSGSDDSKGFRGIPVGRAVLLNPDFSSKIPEYTSYYRRAQTIHWSWTAYAYPLEPGVFATPLFNPVSLEGFGMIPLRREPKEPDGAHMALCVAVPGTGQAILVWTEAEDGWSMLLHTRDGRAGFSDVGPAGVGPSFVLGARPHHSAPAGSAKGQEFIGWFEKLLNVTQQAFKAGCSEGDLRKAFADADYKMPWIQKAFSFVLNGLNVFTGVFYGDMIGLGNKANYNQFVGIRQAGAYGNAAQAGLSMIGAYNVPYVATFGKRADRSGGNAYEEDEHIWRYNIGAEAWRRALASGLPAQVFYEILRLKSRPAMRAVQIQSPATDRNPVRTMTGDSNTNVYSNHGQGGRTMVEGSHISSIMAKVAAFRKQ